MTIPREYISFNYRQDAKMRPYFHSHTANEIYYFHRGQCRYLLHGNLVRLEPGDLIVLNGMREHGPLADANYEYVRSTIMFEKEAVKGIRSLPGMLDIMKPFLVSTYYHWRLAPPAREEFELLLSRLHAFERQSGEAAELRRNLLFYDILLFVYERFAATTEPQQALPSEQEQFIFKVLDWIDEHYTEEMTVEGIASRMNVSKFYLMKLFKRLTGDSLMNYVLGKRIARAKFLFATQAGGSVTDVCYAAGFSDLSHFSRTFKKLTGITPKQYKELK